MAGRGLAWLGAAWRGEAGTVFSTARAVGAVRSPAASGWREGESGIAVQDAPAPARTLPRSEDRMPSSTVAHRHYRPSSWMIAAFERLWCAIEAKSPRQGRRPEGTQVRETVSRVPGRLTPKARARVSQGHLRDGAAGRPGTDEQASPAGAPAPAPTLPRPSARRRGGASVNRPPAP